jgi:hypothetical protein
MITPETKSWTWVLEHPCTECAFDASATPAQDVASGVRVNATEWQRLLGSGAIRAGRPNESTWSSLEYACHVRDVYRRMHARMDVMLTADDPVFANWDQDASAVDDRYDEQDPATVVGELDADATTMADRLEALTAEKWSRSGRRSDGAPFTVDTISRYMLHDTTHHVWDVTRASSE